MCANGGFNLTKFTSISQVMMSVPPEDRAKEIKGLSIESIDKLPIERVLGVHWCIDSDAFKCRIELKGKQCTRRGILATTSTIFGLIASVVLVGKKILQEICHGKGWDEPIDGEASYRYLNSSTSQETSSLFILEELLPHSYKTCQTHHKLDMGNALISDWLMKTVAFIFLKYWVKPVWYH